MNFYQNSNIKHSNIKLGNFYVLNCLTVGEKNDYYRTIKEV